MTNAQRSIKYLAIAFAVFLIVAIFSAIFFVVFALFNVTGFISSGTAKSDLDHSKYTTYVDVNLKYANLVIKNGETIKVENNNDKIKVEADNNKLIITDDSNWFSRKSNEEVVVYIPNYITYDIVNISTGAGKIRIDGFKTKELKLDLGAGEATLNNIDSNKSNVSTGTGKVEFNNCILNDAKLDLGIGAININSNITGNSEINCGIGSVKLNLPGNKDEYTFDINKGIGSITYNQNNNVGDKSRLGTGSNFIKIDGGIGSITITTK